MRESAPPASGCRRSARSRRPRDKRRRALIVGAAVVVRAGAGRGDRRRSRRTPARTTAATRRARSSRPPGRSGKDGLAIPVGEDERPVDAHGVGGLPLPGLQGLRERLTAPTIHELTDAGQLKVEYHLATIIDGNMGGSGSLQRGQRRRLRPGRREVPRVPRRPLPEPAAGDRTTRSPTRQQAARAGRARSTGWTPPPSAAASRTARTTAGSQKSNERLPRTAASAARRPCCSTARTSSPRPKRRRRT